MLHSEQFLLYRVFDALTDSFFPLLARWTTRSTSSRRRCSRTRPTSSSSGCSRSSASSSRCARSSRPQRDLFARSVDQIAELPGLELDERDYFRDVYDHLIRISDLIDSYRDLLSGATDLYLSTVSNRQNDVMKQLTVIATIFLPLCFITGFFGQNFGYLVSDRSPDVVVLGAGRRQHARHLRLPAELLPAQGLDVTAPAGRPAAPCTGAVVARCVRTARTTNRASPASSATLAAHGSAPA